MKEYILNLLKNSIKKTNHDGIVSHWVGDLSVDDIRYIIEYIEGLEKKLKELEDMISELELEHRFMRDGRKTPTSLD